MDILVFPNTKTHGPGKIGHVNNDENRRRDLT